MAQDIKRNTSRLAPGTYLGIFLVGVFLFVPYLALADFFHFNVFPVFPGSDTLFELYEQDDNWGSVASTSQDINGHLYYDNQGGRFLVEWSEWDQVMNGNEIVTPTEYDLTDPDDIDYNFYLLKPAASSTQCVTSDNGLRVLWGGDYTTVDIVSSTTPFLIGNSYWCWKVYESLTDAGLSAGELDSVYRLAIEDIENLFYLDYSIANLTTLDTESQFYNFLDVLPQSFATTTERDLASDICGGADTWFQALTTNGLCRVAVFLFYPSNQFKDDLIDNYDEFKESFPFSLFYVMSDGFLALTFATTTPDAIEYQPRGMYGENLYDGGVDGEVEIFGTSTYATGTAQTAFSDLRDILGYLMYLSTGVLLYLRVKSIV